MNDKNVLLKSLGDVELYLLSLLVFFLPFEKLVTLKEVIFILLTTIFIVNKFLLKRDLRVIFSKNRLLHILIIVSIVWALVALVTAIKPYYSFHEIITKMTKQYLVYFIAFCIAYSQTDQKKLRIIFYSLILSAGIMSIYGCFQFYVNPAFFDNRISGFTGAFYRLATLLVISIPAAIILLFKTENRLKFVLFLFLLLMLIATFLTFTRSAWLGIIVEATILIFIFFKRYRKIFVIFVVLMVSTVILLSNESILPKKILIRGSEKPRLEAFKLSINILKEYPITGIGYGKKTFSFKYPDVSEVKHSHNIIVNTAIETGLIGSFLMLFILFIIIRDLFMGINSSKNNMFLIIIFTSATGYLVLNLFDYMYHGWPGQLFWILIGMGYGVLKRYEEISI